MRAVPSGGDADDPTVRVLLVPFATSEGGPLRFDQLVPSDDSLRRIADRLEGVAKDTRVIIEPPVYRGITVVAKLRGRPHASPTRLKADALRALYEYLDPVTGGAAGNGWPFGRAVTVSEIQSVLQALPDVATVEDVRLFPADPVGGERGHQTQSVTLEAHALVFSYGHEVHVDDA